MNNSNLVKVFALANILFVFVCLGELTNHMQEVRALVVAAAEERSAHTRKASDVYGNFSSGGPWCVRFRELADQMPSSWEVIVNNFEEIAQTDMEKAMVICAWQAMGSKSPENHLRCLQAAAGLVEQGRLDRDLFWHAQLPLLNVAYNNLAHEYRSPVAQDILKRSKAIFHDAPDKLAQYDRYLSGETRKTLEKKMRNLNWWKYPAEDNRSTRMIVFAESNHTEEVIDFSSPKATESHSQNSTGKRTKRMMGVAMMVGSLLCVLFVFRKFLSLRNKSTERDGY